MKLLRILGLWPPFGGTAGTPAYEHPSLAAAVRSRLLESVPGVAGVYHTQVPTRAARPYIVMFEMMTAPVIANITSVHGAKTFQFTTVSDDDMEAETVGRSAIAALSLPDRLLFETGRHMSGWVGTERKMVDPGTPESLGQAFRFEFDFTFLVQW